MHLCRGLSRNYRHQRGHIRDKHVSGDSITQGAGSRVVKSEFVDLWKQIGPTIDMHTLAAELSSLRVRISSPERTRKNQGAAPDFKGRGGNQGGRWVPDAIGTALGWENGERFGLGNRAQGWRSK